MEEKWFASLEQSPLCDCGCFTREVFFFFLNAREVVMISRCSESFTSFKLFLKSKSNLLCEQLTNMSALLLVSFFLRFYCFFWGHLSYLQHFSHFWTHWLINTTFKNDRFKTQGNASQQWGNGAEQEDTRKWKINRSIAVYPYRVQRCNII